ncbi:GMC family oxidoreductase [Arthrobacter sp. zg-Y820]|uniref:GMC family oxidoreductase n=1 Tax=unclassified Arthrobacter TaxID=235627 RepID=UPI002541EF01|nr:MULTISPECIES: GMC family oxidoreductase [unclassified Arthrobacter]MCC9197249.1 GMC family oxidoreductase [Arthrobacter sp. zg-Y820]MDK1280114.1 GMC family oxidoreductase [Arthrobacter sp. zg.Y820]WIB09406.1 GMC family oxidoreductase [Arthrobacter sp. zg-Y820]
MAKIEFDDKSAVVVIGTGAGGGTVLYELTKSGVPVVALEAGGHILNEDYVNNEWEAFNQMAWLDPRTTSGSWRVARDFPNLPAWIVKAVGGSTTHWSGATPRFKAHEFTARSTYGRIEGANLEDWPISLADLEPYYDAAEKKMGSTHRHGRPALPANNNYKVFANGAEKIGYRHYATGPYATNAEPYDGRPASIQDGFNFQGDKNKSKWSTLVSEIPKAEKTGLLDLRPNSQAVQITVDAFGKADGVIYIDADGQVQRQLARAVCVAGNAIETPRLLLMSADSRHPDGLSNYSGQVGRNYMRHTTGSVYARFDQPVRMYRGETMAGIIADESRHDTGRGFSGGYYMETLSLGPAFLASFVDPGTWGPTFAHVMAEYLNTAGMWIVGEDMPQESNRITLNSAVTDPLGLPVPNVHFDDHPNDVAMREHAYQQADLLYSAVGSDDTTHTPPYPSTHNLGTARMSSRPEDGVVNAFGQSHEISNLFVSDGSVFTTGAAANPTLTIVALATRQAEYIVDQMHQQFI